MTFPFDWLTRKNKLNALWAGQQAVTNQLEKMMSDIIRETQESRESIDALKLVVTDVVQRLLDGKAADAATIAAQVARIAALEGVEVEAAAASADLDAQQAENQAFADQLRTVGIEVTPPPAEPTA